MTNDETIMWLEQIKEKYIHGGDEDFDEKRKEAIDNAIAVLRKDYIMPRQNKVRKARSGEYVLYQIDFLLDNLTHEINLLESGRKLSNHIEDEIRIGAGCFKCANHTKCQDAFSPTSHYCNNYGKTQEEFEQWLKEYRRSDN